jgi:sugar phosphate isomerase/epimerase
MKIAIQEDMLPGRTITEKFERAADAGLHGVELWARDLSQHIPEIAEAIIRTGVAVSAVHFGRQGRLLDAHPSERERALFDLRQAIMDSCDLGANAVLVVPAYHGTTLPDLTPLISSEQLEKELFHAHMRTLGDYANAMGGSILITALNRYETHLVKRISTAAEMAQRVNSPAMGVAAGTFHMALEEGDLAAAIRACRDDIRYLHIADSHRGLPGTGAFNWGSIGAALNEIGYQGWLSLECGTPGANHAQAEGFYQGLPAALEALRAAGIN